MSVRRAPTARRVPICLVRVLTLNAASPKMPSAAMPEQQCDDHAQVDGHGAVVRVGVGRDVLQRAHLQDHATVVHLVQCLLGLLHQRITLARLRANHVTRIRLVRDHREQGDVADLVPTRPRAVHVVDDAEDRDRLAGAGIDRLAEGGLLRKQLLGHILRDQDSRGRERTVARRLRDDRRIEVAPCGQLDPERVEALLVHLEIVDVARAGPSRWAR